MGVAQPFPNAVLATAYFSPNVARGSPFFRSFVCSFIANVKSARLFIFAHPHKLVMLLQEHLQHPRVQVLALQAPDSELFVGMNQTGKYQSIRYATYKHLLDSLPGNIQSVALVDASDTIFQHDPFEAFALTGADRLYFTEESRTYTLGTQSSNALWVRELYGERRELLSQPVLCSAFTIGSLRPMRQYLGRMSAEVERLRSSGALHLLEHRFGTAIARGFDQGIHNVVARSLILEGGKDDDTRRRIGPGVSATTLGAKMRGSRSPIRATALSISDGLVMHGNGLRGDGRGREHAFVLDRAVLRACVRGSGETESRRYDGESAAPITVCSKALEMPFSIVHQYGKVRSLWLQRLVRRRLTCRDGNVVPAYCNPPQVGRGGTRNARQLQHLHAPHVEMAIRAAVGLCSPRAWLGEKTWNATWRD
jgi:hypothetical protein